MPYGDEALNASRVGKLANEQVGKWSNGEMGKQSLSQDEKVAFV